MSKKDYKAKYIEVLALVTNKKYVESAKILIDVYKNALKNKDLEYCYKSCELLNEVCYPAVFELTEKAKEYKRIKSYKKYKSSLKQAQQIAYVGAHIEAFYKKEDCFYAYTTITKQLDWDYETKVKKFKAGVAKCAGKLGDFVFEATSLSLDIIVGVLDFVGGVLENSETASIETEQQSNSTQQKIKQELEVGEENEQTKVYNKAIEMYNEGLFYYNNEFYENSYDYYKEIYKYCKINELTELKEDCAEILANSCYFVAYDLYDRGYEQQSESFHKAESLLLSSREWAEKGIEYEKEVPYRVSEDSNEGLLKSINEQLDYCRLYLD